jgi:lysophospholipase L1-like esterase
MQWYEAEVRALVERTWSAHVNGQHPPVFYGSSTIRLWETLAEDIDPGIVNLGFGGSTLEACDYFFARIVPPVTPRSLLLYAGDNDLGDGRTPDQILRWFRSLAAKLAKSLGPIPFGFVSVKPSPARYPIVDRIRRLNEMVRHEIESIPSGYYVDVFSAMLGPAGKPIADYYLEDGLHLNRKGYRVWGELLAPYRNQIFTD